MSQNYKNDSLNEEPIQFDEEDNTIQNLTESSSNLYCWGFGKYGQVGKQFINYSIDPIYIQLEYETQDDDIFQLYSGENHNAILTFNSTLYTFGKNVFGQLGLGNTNYAYFPQIVKFPDNIKITKVSLGGEHTLAKSENGMVFSFGLNIFGQLGTGDTNIRTSPTKVNINGLDNNEDIVDICAGAQHSLLISSKFRIFTCGYGKNGSLGFGICEDVLNFSPIENSHFVSKSKNGIKKVICGVYHSCCIFTNDTDFAIWGVGDILKYPEITINNVSNIISHEDCQIKDIKIGDDFLLLLTSNDSVYACGKNNQGQLGLGHNNDKISFTKILFDEKIQQVEAGFEHVIAITFDKKIYGWGSNEYGQLSLIDQTTYNKPTFLTYLTQLDIMQFSCGGYHNIALFTRLVKDNDNVKQDKVTEENNINLDIFRNNLNIVKLSSTLKKDIPPIIKKIKIFDQVKGKLNELKEHKQELENKINELKLKEKSLGFLPTQKLSELTRGFDNTFEIKLSEIEFNERHSDIGKGTFGEVKRGVWRGEEVAVKFLKTTMLTSSDTIAAFIEECNIMKNLRHPNILLYMGASTKGPDFFVVTEFCENGNLFELLHLNRNYKLNWEEVRRMALEISYGMNYLHSFNPPILHRDLKSMNVLLGKKLQVKLADFGNTKLLDVQMTKQKGTFQWMAPEVIKGNVYSEKSDVFSFGIIMNELATRTPPYQGVDKKEVARKVLTRPDYRPAYKKLPKDWIDLMTRCYDQNEKKRPNFNEIIDCLKRAKLGTGAILIPTH